MIVYDATTMSEPTKRENLIAELRRLSTSMHSPKMHLAAPLMDLDLTIPQLRAIFLLAGSGAMHMSPVAEGLGITLSACSHLVDKLVRSGLVARSVGPSDRRVVVCTLTEAGQALAEQLRQSIPFERQEFLDRLTVEELGIVIQAMTIFQRVMVDFQAEIAGSSKEIVKTTIAMHGRRGHAHG
jgi:DNA-binding MarR family transcriptional regulator